jgi:hypothetical protein
LQWLLFLKYLSPLIEAIHSYTSIKRDKHSRDNCHWNYWLNRHDCHSDYRSNRKYHRAIHSYIPINVDKHSRNNCHWNC